MSGFGRHFQLRSAVLVFAAVVALTFGLVAAPTWAAPTPTLIGIVTGDGAAMADVEVRAYDAQDWSAIGVATTDTAGRFELTDLPAGWVVLHFSPSQDFSYGDPLPYLPVYSGDVASIRDAERVWVDPDSGPATYDMELTRRYGAISGSLTLDGQRPDGVTQTVNIVGLAKGTGLIPTGMVKVAATALKPRSNHYQALLAPGDYYVMATGVMESSGAGNQAYLSSFWPAADTPSEAELVEVEAGQVVTGRDFDLSSLLQPRQPPQVSAEPTVGELVVVDPGVWARTVNVEYTVWWTGADGDSVPGFAYTPTAADAGKRLRVDVNAGWKTFRGWYSLKSQRVKHRVDLEATAKEAPQQPGQMMLRIRATSPTADVSQLRGRVVLTDADAEIASTKLTNGKARILLPEPEGKEYSLSFTGNRALHPATLEQVSPSP